MASKILSRWLPPAVGAPSVYETLRKRADSPQSDEDAEAAIALDEEFLGADFQNYHANGGISSLATRHSTKATVLESSRQNHHRSERTPQNGSELLLPTTRAEAEEIDDDVPQSLLIEDGQDQGSSTWRTRTRGLPPPVPGPPSRGMHAKWRATQEHQRLHRDSAPFPNMNGAPAQRVHPASSLDPKERALWMWANVENLDNFIGDAYDYYIGRGAWSIILHRMLRLLTAAFVLAFSTFLIACIEYPKIPGSKKLSQIVVPQCTRKMSSFSNLIIWVTAFVWTYRFFTECYDLRRLKNMQNFYRYALGIPDSDIQTVSWQEVVKQLMALRDLNPATAAEVQATHRRFLGSQSKQRMDAHDIANRLMRRDNYLIALINKDVLDLTIPLPFLKKKQFLSRTLELNLHYCILDFVFDNKDQIRPLLLKDTHRRTLSLALQRRFRFAGLANVLIAPFVVVYSLLLYFFRYFTEYQRNPSQISSRQYTPFAEWKFREFNELPHLFQRRINMSFPFASRYLDQFPKDKTVQIAKFIAFVTGALASVLAIASVIDPESFLAFEITPERTVLFYLGIFGTVWAVARGTVPEENHVFDPEYALSNVTEYTHYMPHHWRGRLHTNDVRTEFAALYQLKITVFLEEILSVIVTPFILWFSLPRCSDRLIDFFREFTIHVDGLGYVCSFAVFDFNKGGNNLPGPDVGNAQELREQYYTTKDDKMIASYYGFIDNYVTNQRSGAPFLHPPSKTKFHAPPTFPGLMSPTLAAEIKGQNVQSSRTGRSDRSQRFPNRSSMSGAQPIYPRTPRFAPTGGQSSPMASILLDPHHQPSAASLRAQRKAGAQSRLRNSQMPFKDPVEDEEDDTMEDAVLSGGDDGEGVVDESNLGESWKTTRAGTVDEGEDQYVQATDHDKGPGVLGLIYQFTEGKGYR